MKALLRKEALEIIRTKKLLILLIIFIFVAISSPIIAKLIPTLFKNIQTQGITLNIPDPSWRDAVDQYVKNISQIVMIVLVFLFAGSVADEKSKKTLEMLLTKPISRGKFILAKASTAFLSTSAVYAICALIFYTYTVSIFGNFSLGNFAVMAALILLYLLQVIAVTIMSSTFVSNQIISAGIAFFIEIVVVTILGSIDRISKYLPGYILGHYREILSGDRSGLLPTTFIMAAIIIVTIFIAFLAFQRQEIER